ncbi:hypothetical protein GGI42DRAFT_89969 [Trichoderma sp. SZMC 28013]
MYSHSRNISRFVIYRVYGGSIITIRHLIPSNTPASLHILWVRRRELVTRIACHYQFCCYRTKNECEWASEGQNQDLEGKTEE